jgi:hypothetical protein
LGTGADSFKRVLGSTITTAILDIPNYVRTRHVTIANELGQVGEVEHDARRPAAILGKDGRAALISEIDVALSVLWTKLLAGDLKNVELSSGKRAAHNPSKMVTCCLTDRA